MSSLQKFLTMPLAVTVLSLASTAFAVPIAVTNGDFTTGDFTGWTTTPAPAGNSMEILYDGGNPYVQMRYGSPVYPPRYIEQNLGVAIDASQVYTINLQDFERPGWGGSYYVEFIGRDGGGDQTLAKVYGNTNQGTYTYPQLQVSGSELAGAAGKDLVIRIGTGTNGYHTAGIDNVVVDQSGGPSTLGAATPIAITNASFESGNTVASDWTGGGWRAGGPGGYGGYLTIGAADGQSAISANDYQVLSDTFIEGAVYTLSAEYWPRFTSGPGSIYLASDDQSYWANGTVSEYLDGASIIAPDQSQWLPLSLEYTATAADAGKAIVVMLQGAFLDNIQLSYQMPATQAVPEPATIALWSILGMVALAFGALRTRTRTRQ